MAAPLTSATSQANQTKTAEPKVTYKTYNLNYIRANIQQFRLVAINAALDMGDAIKVAKHYCARSNYRFVFLEDAIITIDDLPTDGE